MEQLQGDSLQEQAELITKLDTGRSERAGIGNVAAVDGAVYCVLRRTTMRTGCSDIQKCSGRFLPVLHRFMKQAHGAHGSMNQVLNSLYPCPT